MQHEPIIQFLEYGKMHESCDCRDIRIKIAENHGPSVATVHLIILNMDILLLSNVSATFGQCRKRALEMQKFTVIARGMQVLHLRGR